MWILCCFLVLFTHSGFSLAQNSSQAVAAPAWSVKPFHPHAIPLAVRSPFLSSWAAGGNGSASLANQWPTLWDMKNILGWALFVNVDGVAYRIMGQAPLQNGAQVANQTAFSFTATQTKFFHTAGPVTISTSFINPIEPSNLVLQSLPAAYLSISVQSNDGNRHRIQVYSDISAEWISGDDDLTAIWNTTTTSSSVIHSVRLLTPQAFTVVNNHIQDATAYYGIMNGDGITWQTGADVDVRSQFMAQGVLLNTQDIAFRAVDKNFPVLGLSMDLGTITNSNFPVVYALGHIRNPAVKALSPAGEVQERSQYFWTQFSSPFDAMDYFISDFARAESAASAFDTSVRSTAAAVSEDYADLIDLSVRQVFGMIEITVAKDSNGNWNESDVQAFMTDTGASVNTVDIMYPSFPVFLQTNPVIAGALLKPLLAWQQNNGYPNPWAAHDLGHQYPTALGDTGAVAMPVEESANMLIMTLAQARASGDATLLVNYYNILDKWAQYLVSNAINPSNQDFTDSFLTGPVMNDVNLALKGIIGVQAMSRIATAINNSAAATRYSDIASGLLTHWLSQAFSTDQSHLLLNFGNESSSLGLPYNLYADKLLGLNMIPQKVYDQTAALVKSQIQSYGMAMDSRSPTASKTDWALFTAAALSDSDARNGLISSVRRYAANLLGTAVPFSDYYDVSQGTSINFQARPVQGAMYSILALQIPSKPISIPVPQSSTTSPSSPSRSHKDGAPSARAFSLLFNLASVAFAILANSSPRVL